MDSKRLLVALAALLVGHGALAQEEAAEREQARRERVSTGPLVRELPAVPVAARRHPACLWTGSRLALWGGRGLDGSRPADGAAFDPEACKWTVLRGTGLQGRQAPVLVARGEILYVWGGGEASDGAAYDLLTGEHTVIPPAPIEWRLDPVAVATESGLLVFGGVMDRNALGRGEEMNQVVWTRPQYRSDGAAWAIPPGKWSKLPAFPCVPREQSAWLHAGGKLLVWGGRRRDEPFSQGSWDQDGAVYDQASNAWTKTPACPAELRFPAAFAFGTRVLVWGSGSGALFDPGSNSWSEIQPCPVRDTSPGLPGRSIPARMTGGRLFVWDGEAFRGALLDPGAGSWVQTPPCPVSPRSDFVSAWAGSSLVIWGGHSFELAGRRFFADGAVLDTWANAWRKMAACTLEIGDRYGPLGAAGDSCLLVWGGWKGLPRNVAPRGTFGSAALYDLARDEWTALDEFPFPWEPGDVAAWTGASFVLVHPADGRALAVVPPGGFRPNPARRR